MSVYIYQPTKKFLRFVRTTAKPKEAEIETLGGITNVKISPDLVKLYREREGAEDIGLFVTSEPPPTVKKDSENS